MAAKEHFRSIKVQIDPGVCGFKCKVTAVKEDARKVAVNISDSGCLQIQHMSEQLTHMSLKELFLPISRNPVYRAAEKSGCHASCVIPAAVLKAVEVAMEMAVARNVNITIDVQDLPGILDD